MDHPDPVKRLAKGADLDHWAPLVVGGRVLGAYLLVAFTLTGLLLDALLLGGLLLAAEVCVLPGFFVGQSIGRFSFLLHRSSVVEHRSRLRLVDTRLRVRDDPRGYEA